MLMLSRTVDNRATGAKLQGLTVLSATKQSPNCWADGGSDICVLSLVSIDMILYVQQSAVIPSMYNRIPPLRSCTKQVL